MLLLYRMLMYGNSHQQDIMRYPKIFQDIPRYPLITRSQDFLLGYIETSSEISRDILWDILKRCLVCSLISRISPRRLLDIFTPLLLLIPHIPRSPSTYSQISSLLSLDLPVSAASGPSGCIVLRKQVRIHFHAYTGRCWLLAYRGQAMGRMGRQGPASVTTPGPAAAMTLGQQHY